MQAVDSVMATQASRPMPTEFASADLRSPIVTAGLTLGYVKKSPRGAPVASQLVLDAVMASQQFRIGLPVIPNID